MQNKKWVNTPSLLTPFLFCHNGVLVVYLLFWLFYYMLHCNFNEIWYAEKLWWNFCILSQLLQICCCGNVPLQSHRCGNVPLQIRRSECRRFVRVTLPAVAKGYCVFIFWMENRCPWGRRFFTFNEYRGFGKTVSVFIKYRVNRLQFVFCQSRKVKNSYRACQVVIAWIFHR